MGSAVSTGPFDPCPALRAQKGRFLGEGEGHSVGGRHMPDLTGRDVHVTDEPVTDTKWLHKGTRKRLQVSRAGRSSSAAKLVKLADKICNLRDILASPPADWSLERKREYFDWAKSVIDRVRGANARHHVLAPPRSRPSGRMLLAPRRPSTRFDAPRAVPHPNSPRACSLLRPHGRIAYN
jgi:hypothetical protein